MKKLFKLLKELLLIAVFSVLIEGVLCIADWIQFHDIQPRNVAQILLVGSMAIILQSWVMSPNKDWQIYWLWKLLDDIDTADDMFKPDMLMNVGYAKYIYGRHRKRFTIVPDDQIEDLYDKYYREGEDDYAN